MESGLIGGSLDVENSATTVESVLAAVSHCGAVEVAIWMPHLPVDTSMD